MDLDRLFTPLERQVIVLAATHERECPDLERSRPDGGWLAGILRTIFPDAAVRPLANERLEALRRLACACFGNGGRPDKDIVRTALAAGINRKQVANLNGLARRYVDGN